MDKKKIIKIDKLLCMLLILCPILDMLSFIFRNTFETKISPSTFLRPIISIIVIIYIVITDKNRFKIIGVGTIYRNICTNTYNYFQSDTYRLFIWKYIT